jgi:hypothetical protein
MLRMRAIDSFGRVGGLLPTPAAGLQSLQRPLVLIVAERNGAGHDEVPVLGMHTTGDGLVVPENEQAYRSAVDRAGDGRLLQQIFVGRAGHCAFTPAETITAVQVLISRLGTGRWNLSALSPASLNAHAAALGPQYNIFLSGGTVVATPPAFLRYQPAPYLRPFDLAPGDGQGQQGG